MATVSVLIPARNEKYLEKTLRNVLDNAEGDTEIICVLDGYLPDPQIHMNDDRVTFMHFPEAVGHRKATNEAAKVAKGKFIMKLDAHCAVGKGFDVILAEDCEYDWTVIPRMYNLDVSTWEPKDFGDFNTAVRRGKLHDYLYIGINEKDELRTLYYPHGFNKAIHHDNKDKLIDDTMSCMGPCFFMDRNRFWELGGCDENHEGGWGQQAVEVACKAWLSGGSLKVNKKTWFAHWFRAGDGGFPYPISGNQINRVRAYSKDLWLNDKWPGAKRKFQWMIDKFNPPGWKDVVVSESSLSVSSIHRLIRSMFNLRMTGHPSPIAARKGDRDTIVDLWAACGYKEGVEIGVNRGVFSEKVLTRVKGVKLHCVDPWDTYKDSQLTAESQKRHYSKTMNRLDRFIKNGSCVIHKEYSEDASTKFEDGSLDFILIDGMHTFDGCALDLIKWVPKIRKGGIVALHDYCPMNRNGVVKAVDAYTYCHQIHPWFVTREIINTAFWVVE